MVKTSIDDWVNIPSIMETDFGKVIGTVKYGMRIPIAPGTTPLHECQPGSEERIGREKASYWFVNDEQTIKVRLLSHKLTDDAVTGKGYDVQKFKYTIRKK